LALIDQLYTFNTVDIFIFCSWYKFNTSRLLFYYTTLSQIGANAHDTWPTSASHAWRLSQLQRRPLADSYSIKLPLSVKERAKQPFALFSIDSAIRRILLQTDNAHS